MRGGAPARWAVAAGATTGGRWKGGTVRTAKLEPAGVVFEQSPMDTYGCVLDGASDDHHKVALSSELHTFGAGMEEHLGTLHQFR